MVTLGKLTIAALGLTILVAPAAHASGQRAVQVRQTAVAGRTIVVTVANVSTRPFRGSVVARVLTARGIATIVAFVDLRPESTKDVPCDLPDGAVEIPPLGVVVDDGVPF